MAQNDALSSAIGADATDGIMLRQTGRLPQQRVSPAMVVLGHHLWLYGGVDLLATEAGGPAGVVYLGNASCRYLSDVWLLDLKTNQWTELPRLKQGAWSARRSHARAVALRERKAVLLLGGGRYFAGKYFHDAALCTQPRSLDAAVSRLRLGGQSCELLCLPR